jgi:hypothetical protein
MWSVVARRLAAPSKLWLMSSTPSAPQLLDQATGKRIATVEELRALCEQAQCTRYYGCGDLVTDLSKRKTLRAPPGKVGVEWAGLQAALAQLEREGLLRGPVTAELHDVLLYSPGDFFKPHVDTKKGPKHLMTLAVNAGLCSPCRGGELVLGTDKAGSEEWLPSGAGSFCAWGTDVENKVKPLLSGNRCVAVYNVSAEEFNEKGLEKRKLDSIVDALRSMVKEKVNESSENSTKTHVGFVLEEISSKYSRKNTTSDDPLDISADEVLLKALEHGFGVAKEDLQVLKSVSLTGEGFRGVHGDYIEEVPTDNTNEEQSEQEEDKESGGSICGEFVDASDMSLLKALEYGLGNAKQEAVSFTGEGCREVHGDYIKEVPIDNTKEEPSEQDDREDGKVSGGNVCNELADEVSDDKRTTATETLDGSVVTVLAVDPKAKSPFQQYVVPADCYNSTWMLNAEPDSTCYFGYDPTTNNGTDLYVSCSIYLRIPRKYFPELNVPREQGQCAEGGEENRQGTTAGPPEQGHTEADESGNSK